MKYALWIALAVVLIAIGPALIRNLRGAGKRKDSSGAAGSTHTGTAGRDRDDGDSGDSDGGGGDGGGD